jgi:hypothetical protein
MVQASGGNTTTCLNHSGRAEKQLKNRKGRRAPHRSRNLYPRFCCNAVIYLSAGRRPRMACRVLPDLAVAAAMRANGVVRTERRAFLPPMSPPHTPCSPSASAVAWPPPLPTTPVGSYPTLSPLTGSKPAGLLSVAVLRQPPVARRLPPLTVSRGSLLPRTGGEESGSSSSAWSASDGAVTRFCALIIPYDAGRRHMVAINAA